MAEQQRPTPSGDRSGAKNPGKLPASWSAFFRVAEIRARSTPQLVAISGVVATLAVTFPWVTAAYVRLDAPFDWVWVALLLIADLTVLACLPGLCIVIAELACRAWRVITRDDGPLLPRLARAAARFTAEGRRDMGRWLDGLNGIVVFSVLFTQIVAGAVGVLVAEQAIQDGRPVGIWVLGPVVAFIALCVLPISVPAAVGSFARRLSRERPE